jgi:hypothetical protein
VPPETYSAPPDLYVFVEEGWPLIAAITDDYEIAYKGIRRTKIQPIVKFGRVTVPRAFQMTVMPKDSSLSKEPQPGVWAVTLMYEALTPEDGSGIVLTGVISSPIEVDDALAELRARRPLDWWKRLALMQIAYDAFDHLLERQYPPLDEEELEERTAFLANNLRAAIEAPLAKRYNRITQSHLAEVARIYRAAVEAGKPPTQTVAEQLQASHSTAARWVGQARKAGELGPARAAGGRGGER